MKFLKALAAVGLLASLFGCGQDKVDFQTLDMKAQAFSGVQVQGLSAVEPWGRWTDGNSVTFKFPGKELPKDFRVVLKTDEAFIPNIGKNFDVTVGDQKQSFVGPDSPKTFTLAFKDVPSNTDTISIAIPAPQSPKDLKLTEDPRKLGLRLVSVEIAAPATAQ